MAVGWDADKNREEDVKGGEQDRRPKVGQESQQHPEGDRDRLSALSAVKTAPCVPDDRSDEHKRKSRTGGGKVFLGAENRKHPLCKVAQQHQYPAGNPCLHKGVCGAGVMVVRVFGDIDMTKPERKKIGA